MSFDKPATAEGKARFAVYTELIQTEKSYLEDLRTLQSVYLQPLRDANDSGKGIMAADDILTIFSNIDSIVDVNTHFLTKIETGILTETYSEVVSRTFKEFASYFRMYR